MANRTNHPKHQPTPEQRKQARAMAATFPMMVDIARVFGIDRMTLRKYYREIGSGRQGQRQGRRQPV